MQHAKKVEFCKEGLSPTDPKNVWVDIMMYSYNKEEGHVWAKYFYCGLDKNRFNLEWIFPLSMITIVLIIKFNVFVVNILQDSSTIRDLVSKGGVVYTVVKISASAEI